MYSRSGQSNRGGTEAEERLDVYETVTERILEHLRKGTVPWRSPCVVRLGPPQNFSTQKLYRGINVFLLGCHEYASPWWLTYLQAKEKGGHVRKGEKGFPVVKWGTYEKALEGEPSGENSGDETAGKRGFLKLYTVFNACQIEGIAFPEQNHGRELYTECEQAKAAREMIEGMPNPPVILEGQQNQACYIPALDTVHIPDRRCFVAEWRFYKTLLHEVAHATGHQKRLNRKTLTENFGIQAAGQGRKIYGQEELVAEMTAAFLGAQAGIIEDGFENSAAYLKSWLDALQVKDHKTWLVKAAADAQKAADYVLGATPLNP
jgi:antirestriction protein ArdC